MKGLAAILGVAALVVIGVACGNGVEPTSLGSILPNLRLTLDGVEYTAVEIVGETSPNGSVVCCGTTINVDDMKVVGSGVWHKPDGYATVHVYRPRADGTTDLYTFHPSETPSKVEGAPPVDETDTTPATWTVWTAKLSSHA